MESSTNTGAFAADLLQVQPSATIDAIHDCRLEKTGSVASDDAGADCV
jgi:hypothetical protein